MADKSWKQFERTCATLLGAKRHWANAGGRIDIESDTVVAQAKLVKELSLNALTQLAEEMDRAGTESDRLGLVVAKVRRGRGQASPILVVMTSSMFQDWFDCRSRET